MDNHHDTQLISSLYDIINFQQKQLKSLKNTLSDQYTRNEQLSKTKNSTIKKLQSQLTKEKEINQETLIKLSILKRKIRSLEELNEIHK